MVLWLGIILWFAVFMSGSIAGGLCASKNAKIGSACTSTVFIILSVAVFYFTDGFNYYGLKIETYYTLLSIPISFLVSLPLILLTSAMGGEIAKEYNPLGEDIRLIEYIVLLLILAPLGEEFLFRGILESSLLDYGILIAVIVPALLFSLVHIIPFKNAPRKFLAAILISAFVLGLLAGYFRAISCSLLPAYTIHAMFNLNGKIAERLTHKK